jgi:beta-glucanase (GH16 family)
MRRSKNRLALLGVLLFFMLSFPAGAFAAPTGQAGGQTYTIRPVDTLGSIAARYRVTVNSILAANPSITNPNHLTNGKQLVIPNSTLRPGQSIWDGYTGVLPVTGGRATATPTPTTPSQSTSVPASSDPQPSGVDGNWRLIFQDEFDGSALDSSVWNTAFPWGSTSTTTPALIYRAQNVSVADGALQLTAQRETHLGYPYTSGIVTTYKKFNYQYGFLEIRALVPGGRGLWPAFWSLPANGQTTPEIDTMEILGGSPNSAQLHYHYGQGIDNGTEASGPDFTAGWHTYAVDWEPDAITWYIDGEKQHEFTQRSAIAALPMYLIANLQVGGWPGRPDSTTPFPATYQIDYVRVWQH